MKSILLTGACLAGAVAAMANVSCDDALCGTNEVRRISSPSSALDVVVSVVDCGATTDYVTRVSVGSHGAPLARTADIVRLDSNHGDVGLGLQNEIPVDVTWQSDHEVTLSYPPKTRSSGFYSDVNGVRIERR